jgi:hypothetical protein
MRIYIKYSVLWLIYVMFVVSEWVSLQLEEGRALRAELLPVAGIAPRHGRAYTAEALEILKCIAPAGSIARSNSI